MIKSESYNNVDEIERLLLIHLRKLNKNLEKLSLSWSINNSLEYGRALYAVCDINKNELICSDPPLIIGFVGNGCKTIICVNCYKEVQSEDVCPNGCGLSVCRDCPKFELHTNECNLLKSWSPKCTDTYSGMKSKSLASIRSLLLSDEDKEIIKILQSNRDAKNEQFIDETLNEFENVEQFQNQVETLKHCASVMNTNAFQNRISMKIDRVNVSVRALYPFLAFLNNECTPNTRRIVDRNQVAHLYASKKIAKGEQITTSYTQILWGTPSRQTFLKVTKNFECDCNRCKDVNENGTYLSATKCCSKLCDGIILPIKPSSLTAVWKCNKCATEFNSTKVHQMQSMISGMTNSRMVNSSNLDLIEFIDGRLKSIVPETNQLVIEMKLDLIRKIVCDVNTVTPKEILSAEVYCKEILLLLDNLNAGDCILKGILSYYLYKFKQQALKNLSNEHAEIQEEDQKLLLISKTILKDSVEDPTNFGD